MGIKDLINFLTPDHTIEAVFLDEDATIGDLLESIISDNPTYDLKEWGIVEVPMPRNNTLSYHELYALNQGPLTPETRIKEIQEKHQELLKDQNATVFKLVNFQNTLPVIFRHVPTVPESHYRQIYVLPNMTVRQIIANVTGEMGLKALESSGSAKQPTSADYMLLQLKVHEDGTEEEKQLGDDEIPFELLMENMDLIMGQQIKGYHFIFTVPDSWASKVESVTSIISKGWTATRPLSMAFSGLFGATSPTQPTPTNREISAPIPMANSSIHHRAFGEMDNSGADSAKNPKKNRQSMIAGSRLSSIFSPSEWLGSEPSKPQRHSIVFGQSLPNLISKPLGVENGPGSELNDTTDEELNVMIANLVKDLNIKDGDAMMQLPREKKIVLILQNQQMQNQKMQKQKERVTSPEPFSPVQSGGTLRTGTPRRVIGSLSSTVSFIEPDNSYAGKLHSRYSSWSSFAGSLDGPAEDISSSPNNAAASERPMSPTAAATGFLSGWFGITQQADAALDDELADDSPQYYIDQLLSKSISQKTLTKHLQSLRISLATVKLSWIRQFLDGRGFRALENVLDKTAIKKRGGKPNDLDETLQSECVQCLRALMNTEPGFNQVLRSPSLVAHISYCLYTTNSKLRTKVAEVLAALCVMSPESHRLVLLALSDFRVAHEERYRFEYLVQTLATPISDDIDRSDYSESFEWEYKTACLSLMNALANSPPSLDDRISLRNELRRRGLEDVFQSLKMQSPPESLLIQINVYEDEQHEDWVDLQERAFGLGQIKTEKDGENSELIDTISALGPDDEALYPHVLRTLQQFANAAALSLNQYESDEEEQEDQEEREKVVPISRLSPQFKEDLWTIVEKFGERVFQMRDIEKDWTGCYDDFLESIQHIVGKRGVILSFSDVNSSSSSTSILSASLASSRRHSFIDFEVENLRRDMDEMREDNEKLMHDLAEARREAEEARTQFQQLQLIKSGPPSTTKESPETEPLPSFGRRENHAGVVQRLVQKEKEVTQLRETIERMEKKYKDKAELVTDDEPRKSERTKEIDSTRWNAMLTEVQIQKNKTADANSLADSRQKEIEYLKRALQIVCTRYESAMGERPPPVTEEDQTNHSNQSEGSLQLSKTFEAIARKDEEIGELKEELDKLRKQSSVGLTPSEEVLSLRGSLKDVMLKVQELQALVADRERTIKGLKESVITMEAAKFTENKIGSPQQNSGQDNNGATGVGRIERSNSRSLKLQIRALSAKGGHTEELDEEQEDSLNLMNTISPSTSENNVNKLSITSPGGALSPIGSPTARRVLGGKRPALPPPPPPPGPKHKLFAANANTATTVELIPEPTALPIVQTGSTQQSMPPPQQQQQPAVTDALQPRAVQPMVVNVSAPPPPPPPPAAAANSPLLPFTTPKQVAPMVLPQLQTSPPPPPPPPPVNSSMPLNSGLQRSVSMPAPKTQNPPSFSPPPPPPPPPPPMANNRGIPAPTHGLPPPPPPPPPPPGKSNATIYDGARPSLPVFSDDHRPANPLQPLAMAIPQAAKPKRPMKQLFWNKLPHGSISQTVWEDICNPSSGVGEIELDYTEIEELFCKAQIASASVTASTEKKKPVSLFSVSRANNIAIMLSRIKLSYPDIRIALMEILDEKLTIENLKAIKQYVPTSDEIEIVKEYDGDFDSLGNAEKFYREIVDIPRLSERVSAMIFRRRLEIDVGELKPEMDVLRLTIEELQSSKRLKSLLKTVLVMGNHLNATSYRGNAYGFQLEALLKIRDTKGVEGIKPGSNTLLHYLAKSISAKDPQLLKFMDELPHLEAAARISVQTLLNSVNSLVAGMNQIREEIRVLQKMRISPPNDQFINVMEKFTADSDEGIKMIVAVGQGLDNDLKKLLMFYGEDPNTTKPEDFFGMLVSFSTMLQKSQLENEALAKKLSKNTIVPKNRRPSEVTGGLSVANIRDGHLDDAIRGLRSGLRRNRRDRPMSHLYSELSLDALNAINAGVPRAGVLSHSRQGSRQ